VLGGHGVEMGRETNVVFTLEFSSSACTSADYSVTVCQVSSVLSLPNAYT